MTWLCALALGCSVELWRPSPRRLVAARIGWRGVAWSRPVISPWAIFIPLAVLGVVMVDGPATLVVAVGSGAAAVLVRHWRLGRLRARAAARRLAVVETLSFLVAELRAGAVPEVALASVARELPALAPAARAAARGGDILSVLREAAAEPGNEALVRLGAAWQVAERSGAPIAGALGRVVDRVRDDLDLQREVDAELAPARATARIMALLPIVGLGLGSGIGGNPVRVVLTTWPGAVSASLGIALAAVGLTWIERVARSVES